MKKVMKCISGLALLLLLIAPVLFYSEKITLETNKLLMTAATAGWFVSSLFWMGRGQKSS